MKENKVVEIKNLVKSYGARGFQTKVLKGIDLTIFKNDFIAIMGPSGSGKTTLLNMLSTIDKPTHGTILLDGMDITKAGNKELSNIRKDKIGFIFQDYNLLDTMTLQDNMECLKMVNDAQKATILMVTHDAFSASYAKDVYILKDGSITCKLSKGNDRKEFYDRIIEMQASMGE